MCGDLKIRYGHMQRTISWQVVFFFISFFCEAISGQLQYTIYEEIKQGSIVGSIAKDLGLDIKELSMRKFHIVSRAKRQYFNVNLENGDLYVTDRIDREIICGIQKKCFLNLEAVIESPLNFYTVKVEIQDINDNSPFFSKNTFDVEISESASSGARFALGNAQDPDLGTNSVQRYKLRANEYFTLGEKTSIDGSKYLELVLEKPVDHEKQHVYEFILTAFDGGKPIKTGTALIKILVHDINDNYPVFSQDTYRISLNENTPNGFLVLHLNATDEDEGSNAQIIYSFNHIAENARQTFTIHSHNGDIKIIGELDYEMTESYEITVEAKDGGGLVAHCKVSIQIIDINDNAPEITITSFSTTTPEDSSPGTVIALIYFNDMDSAENGEVVCQISEMLPFQLISSSSSYFKLVTTSNMDRERVSDYNITIKAVDKGSPPLSTNKTIRLTISDVNDNPPVFEKTRYIAYVSENNPPGTSIYSVHASDLDLNKNAQIIYSILMNNVEDIPLSSHVSINSVTGVVYAQSLFDYEQLREFQIQVMAKDSGSPPLSTNVTVKICIIDKNDNAPKILYPSPDTEGTALFEFIPRSSEKGFLVTKIVAVDADSGHNAWLSYHLLHVPEPSFFIIGQYTGEIRMARTFQDTDTLRQRFIVMVKDNGYPSLSATVTLNLVVAENFQQVLPELSIQPSDSDTQSNVTIYLVISIALISLLFILTVMVTVISKCRKSNTPTAFGIISKDFYPQVALRYPYQFRDGTLPLPYSYDVCVAVDSSESEFAYLKPSQNVPVDSLIDTDDSAIGNDSLQDALPSTSLAQVDPNVSISGSNSNPLDITCGIPQGSVLGPLLFSVFINDLPTACKGASIHIYSDDTILYAHSPCLSDLEHVLHNNRKSICLM
ncbi:hypothetical protein FKM82_011927 [Ascaphus truei]